MLYGWSNIWTRCVSLLRYTRTLLSRHREPKTALTGGILENFSARFKASMAAFNAEMVPSRPLCLWDSASMVETQGHCGRTMASKGGEEGSEP